MVKPKKRRPVRRRLLTISLYISAWISLTLLAPFWLVAGIAIGIVRRRSFVTLRLLVLSWCFFGIAILALVRLAAAFARLRSQPAELETRLFGLQLWWSHALLGLACRTLRIRIEIEGADAVVPGPTIVLMRHASILDTLLPSVYLQRPTRWRVRYVMKQELLFDPCLDIVGNSLPNYFVDRSGDRARELDGIRALVQDLGVEGVQIYPEGTRFSPEKRARALERVRQQAPEMIRSAEDLTHVLPPRPAGVLALLDSLPGVDCAFFAHHGLEGFAKIVDIFSGEVVGSSVTGRVWRVPRSEIPETESERVRWLYEQWARVDGFVKGAESGPSGQSA